MGAEWRGRSQTSRIRKVLPDLGLRALESGGEAGSWQMLGLVERKATLDPAESPGAGSL